MPAALKISEAASLGMHSMGLLASRPESYQSSKVIAARFQVSEAHLAKVLRQLVKVGLLHSTRGPGGGFTLARAPGQVTLLEVYQATEGPIEPTGCLFALPQCDGRSCVMGRVLADANDSLYRFLKTTTLADIADIFDQERFQIVGLATP